MGSPASNFISEYTDYVAEALDSSRHIHEALALSLVSILAGRRVFIDFRFGRIFPNLYLLILAPTGEFKSTAIDYVKAILKEVDPEALLPNQFTPEKFIELLGQGIPRLHAIDEFSGFLIDTASKKYLGSLKELFCEVFNCPTEVSRAIRQEKDIIKAQNVFLSLVAATTPAKLEKSLTPIDIASGFLTRFAIVHTGGNNFKKPIEFSRDNDKVMHTRLIQALQAIKYNLGKVTTDIPAILKDYERFNLWVGKLRAEATSEETEEVAEFYNRWIILAAKAALIFEISRNSHRLQSPLVVSAESLQDGIRFAESVISSTKNALADFWIPEEAREWGKLLKFIKSKGRVKTRDVQQRFKWDSAKVKGLARTLQELGHILIERDGRSEVYISIPDGAMQDIRDLVADGKLRTQDQVENFAEELAFAEEEARRLKQLKAEGRL